MSPQVAWASDDGPVCLRIGWTGDEIARAARLSDAELARRIVVLPSGLAGADADDRTAPVATDRLAPAPGRFSRHGADVVFAPRFPFLADRAYTVLVHPALCGADADDDVDLAGYRRFPLAARRAPGAPTTTVVAVRPGGATVPRNLLRAYVHFSAPMSEGDAAGCVQLVDAGTGVVVEGALLTMDPELWDPARTRLTVLLDPARIKRGLAPHRDAGYPLHEGDAVAIVVDRAFRDADGRPLAEGATVRYDVGPDLRTRVDPRSWDVAAPAVGSREPLVVRFGRPLDHALLSHCLAVRGAHGATVPGRAETADDATAWSFRPNAPWEPVRHHLAVSAMLEDVAGNSVTRVFDRDLTDDTQEPHAATEVTVEVDPR